MIQVGDFVIVKSSKFWRCKLKKNSIARIEEIDYAEPKLHLRGLGRIYSTEEFREGTWWCDTRDVKEL